MKTQSLILLVILAIGYSCSDDPVAPNTGTDIMGFEVTQQTGAAIIDNTTHAVTIEVVDNTDRSSLAPVYTLSTGATAVPASGTVVDYTSEVTITVTAEDGTTTQDWKVNMTEAPPGPSDATEILLIVLPEQTSLASISSTNHTVDIEVVNGTNLTNLTPSFLLSIGATSVPVSETNDDYSSEVTITVTAEDNITTQDWKVNVSAAAAGLSDKTDILSFTLPEATQNAMISGDASQVTIEVASGTNLINLTPTFILSPGATSVPTSGISGNYSSIVTITVTAGDGVTVRDWSVTVYLEADFDPILFCQQNLCSNDEGRQLACQEFLTECLSDGTEANYEECVLGALIFCY
jgi:hypothetical protein